jgi:hypothetical protein
LIAKSLLTDRIFARACGRTSPTIAARTAMAALAILAGCAAGEPSAQYSPAAAPVAQKSAPAAEAGTTREPDFTGLWEGTSTSACLPMQPDASRCNAVEKITFQLFQQGAKLTGHYTCATGNMVCRDSNTTGTIVNGKVRASAVDWRVLLPDGSSCLFNGRPSPIHSPGNPAARRLTGAYFCLQGGGYIEKGSYQVERGY